VSAQGSPQLDSGKGVRPFNLQARKNDNANHLTEGPQVSVREN